MGLRIEEQLGVHHVVRVRAGEVRHREGVEIAAVAKDVAAGVVEVEERLEVGKMVGGTDRVDRRIRQLDPMLGREAEHHLGLQRALDVEVELDLGEPLDQLRASGVDVHRC